MLYAIFRENRLPLADLIAGFESDPNLHTTVFKLWHTTLNRQTQLEMEY